MASAAGKSSPPNWLGECASRHSLIGGELIQRSGVRECGHHDRLLSNEQTTTNKPDMSRATSQVQKETRHAAQW
ncbi:hypothetical protein ABIA85_009684 [Bradyrhizobium sp. LA6.10]|uniref:hypothetical protein n=1 Tax=Bradyrhizobium sp. LA6.10 TaxID=3156318 RepID=UPI003399B8B4